MLPPYVHDALSTLKEKGYPSFLVGGCVRDMLLGRRPQDYDLVTPASLDEIRTIFDKTIAIGERYGTLALIIAGQTVQLSTFKGNADPDQYEPMAQLFMDLACRDFTINAMAMNEDGLLYDPWGGQQDLEGGLIRATGNRAEELFSDDPLRMLRAVRLASVYGFTIVPATWQAILNLNNLLGTVARERIREELNRILTSNHPAEGIRLLLDSQLLLAIIPELVLTAGFAQRNPHHDRDVFEHSLAALENTPARLKVRLAALLHDVAKPACFSLDETGKGHFYGHHLRGREMTVEILRRLKYDKQTIADVSMLVGEHMSRFEKLREGSLKRLVNRVGEDELEDLFDLQRADIMASAPPCDFTTIDRMEREIRHILTDNTPLLIRDLVINGHDLMALDLEPGRRMGEALSYLMDAVLEDPSRNQRDILLALARSWLLYTKYPAQ